MTQRPAPPIASTPDAVIESEQRVWSGRFPVDIVKFRNRRFDGGYHSQHRRHTGRHDSGNRRRARSRLDRYGGQQRVDGSCFNGHSQR